MEGHLSLEECIKALDTFESDKTPGEDGFTVEFYKTFFDLIGQDLVASFNAAYEVNELSISQRRGIVTLIPKEDGSLLELQNWRPITLHNVYCKIATKAIAKRIEPYLPTLIHSDQTGFIKGRYIGENIRLIEDVIHRMQIWRTARSSPGTSRMDARLVRLRCFVLTGKSCFVVDLVFFISLCLRVAVSLNVTRGDTNLLPFTS